MKEKVVCAVLVSVLLLSTLLLTGMQRVEAESTTVVYVDPETSYATLGETFSINVSIANVTDLYGYEFMLSWNNTLLECIDAVVTPPAVWAPYMTFGSGIQQNYNATHGRYWIAVSAFPPSLSFDGNTTLAILTFKVLNVGESPLDLYEVTLSDSSANYIEDWTHKDSPDDGYFEFVKPQHDVAVILDSPTHLMPGDSALLNATVFNSGLNNEANVDLRLLINGETKNSTIISLLQVGSSHTISYMWTTTMVESTYNVTAYAVPVPNENFTLNNVESRTVPVSYVIRVPFHFRTIQRAIDAANLGDTILVSVGSYYEHLRINKGLNLVGEERSTPVIDANGTGVAIQVNADNVTISGFTILDAFVGISVFPENQTIVNTVIRDNSIKNTRVSLATGILLFDCENCSIIGNTLSGNWKGLELSQTDGNAIYHNNFINNTEHAVLVSSSDIWDNGCEGNYWDNYTGTDLDGDGIGDTLLPHQGVDNYPLMNPYIKGDVNHDATVNIVDGVVLGAAFGAKPGDSNWNPHADLNGDNIINIADIVLWALHFGETV